MDELDRLYRRMVDNIRGMFPELLAREFDVSQLYQQIVPYRTNRRELGFDSNEDYELALMQLLAGLRGYLVTDSELQRAMRTELASPNPDLTAFRIYATSSVSLAPEPLRALERRLLTQEDERRTTPSLSASEQATLAGRATESLDVTSDSPVVPPSRAAGASSVAGSPAPRPATPAATPAAPIPPVTRQAPAPPSAPAASARPVEPGTAAAPGAPSASAAAHSPRPHAPPSAAAAPAPPRPPRAAPQPPPSPSMPVPRSTAPAVTVGATCRYCSGVLPDGRRVTFCPSCGHNLTVQHCPACATELEVDWKFCITCGRGIEGGSEAGG